MKNIRKQGSQLGILFQVSVVKVNSHILITSVSDGEVTKTIVVIIITIIVIITIIIIIIIELS
jgi:hypothetical protein